MTSRTKQIEKAKKLKALAERGIGGEKTNAQRMYDDYCARFNISEEEVINCQIGKDSAYANMSDDDFIAEMLGETFALSVGVIMASFFGTNSLKRASKQMFSNHLSRCVDKIVERANHKTK